MTSSDAPNGLNVPELCDALIASQLHNEAEVDALVEEWNGAEEDGGSFIDWLLERGTITQLESEALRAGVASQFTLGPYRVVEWLYESRVGDVYRATHEEFSQAVCLKVYPPEFEEDPILSRKLSREMRVSTMLDHPNIARTFHLGRAGGCIVISFEELQGETLADRLERDNILPLNETLRIGQQIADALTHLEEKSITHGDVQPETIWIFPDGRVVLIGFSNALDEFGRLDDEDEDEPVPEEEIFGDLDYLSAEQALDERLADTRSDLYSLGCVLFRCLTGEVVFPDRNPVRKMLAHALGVPYTVEELNEDVPRNLSEIVNRLLAKEQADRFQHAKDAAWALQQLLDADDSQAAVAREISPDFLAWANSTSELNDEKEDSALLGEPELYDFLDFLIDRRKRKADVP